MSKKPEDITYEEFREALIEGRITIEPKKKWEPKDGGYVVNGNGHTTNLNPMYNEPYRLHGTMRSTREQAEKFAKDQRKFNRLHAYVAEHAPHYVVPPLGERAWFIYEDGAGDFYAASDANARDICKIYMPKEVAMDLARKLNSGEVEL